MQFIAIFLLSVLASAAPQSKQIYKTKSQKEQIDWIALDSVKREEVLVKERGGSFIRIRLSDAKVLGRYQDKCDMKKSPWDHLEWAAPYLVSPSRNCILNEDSQTFEQLPKNALPTNAFYVSYLGQGSGKHFFLLNSRPWKGEGFLHLKTIDHASGKSAVQALVDGVPGFSSAMSLDLDGKNFLYTEATGESANRLYTLAVSDLFKLAQSSQPAPFQQLAKKIAEFPGLSMWMSAGSSRLLYGDDRSAYLIDRAKGQKLEQQAGSCALAALVGESILSLCDSKEIFLSTDTP